jgi:hypothetical protein
MGYWQVILLVLARSDAPNLRNRLPRDDNPISKDGGKCSRSVFVTMVYL